MSERDVKLYVIDLPERLGICYEQASHPDNLRKYVTMKTNTVLPGDIKILCEPSMSGGWYIEIWETPDLPEPAA